MIELSSMLSHLWSFFVPNKENEYQPQSLRNGAVIGMTVLVVLSFAIANIQSLLWIASDWMVSTILPAVIVTETNEARTTRARDPLVRSEVLDRAATLKAEDMARGEYFAHVSPSGVTPWHWFDEAGYSFVHAGENLAVYFTDSSEIVDAWMDSPLHRKNILDSEYAEIGIGVAKGRFEGYDTVYVVQLFGTPAEVVATTAPSTPTAERQEPTITASSEGTEPLVAGITDTAIAEAPENLVTEEGIHDKTIALYSEHISTSTNGVPAYTAPTYTTDGTRVSNALRLITQPSVVLQSIYVLIATFVFFALLFAVLIDIRRQHPIQIMYSVGLLAVMLVLFHVHIAVSSGVLIA